MILIGSFRKVACTCKHAALFFILELIISMKIILFLTEKSKVPFQTWWEQGRTREIEKEREREQSVVKGTKFKKCRVFLFLMSNSFVHCIITRVFRYFRTHFYWGFLNILRVRGKCINSGYRYLCSSTKIISPSQWPFVLSWGSAVFSVKGNWVRIPQVAWIIVFW